MPRIRNPAIKLKFTVVIHEIVPHGPKGLKIFRSGKKWTDKHGEVHQARKLIRTKGLVTHEAHLDGRSIGEAKEKLELPDSDCVLVYRKYGDWYMLHGDDTYYIVTWRDLVGEGATPATRKSKGSLVYFLRKTT